MDGQTPIKRKSFKRRAFRALAFLLLVGLVTVGALPWLLGTPPARRAIVAAVNRALAPSRVGLRGLSLSWTGSIRLSGVSLRDGHGKTLLDARLAVLNRGLFALLLDRSRLGMLTLDGAAVDIERRADGTIDLVDALMPPPSKTATTPPSDAKTAARPATDITLRVVRGSLRLKTPELIEPLTAKQMDMEVRVPAAAGQKLSWKIRLEDPLDGTSAVATLGIDGEFDHRAEAMPDLALTIKGEQWPLAVAGSGMSARGRFDGVMKAARESGRWSSSADAKVLALDAAGAVLNGDRLSLDVVSAGWDVAESAAGWSIRRLAVVAPVGTLSATASIATAGASAVPEARVEGKLDLASLAKQLPHTLRLRDGLSLEHGSARVVVQLKTVGEAQLATAEANVSDLVARNASRAFTLRDPAAVTARASRSKTGVSVEALVVKTAFLDLTGSGDLDRGVKLAGTIDLGGLETQFRDLIDFGAIELAGKGRMAGDFRKTGATFVGRYAAEVRGLKVAGLSTKPLIRDAMRFDAAVSGPADASGMPRSWENLRVNLKSSLDTIAMTATSRDKTISVKASASLPVPAEVSSRDGQADVSLAARFRPGRDPLGQGVIDLDEVRLGLRPADPALVATGTLALAVKGSIDLDGDDLSLFPLPLPASYRAAAALAPEGLKLHGIRKTPLAQRAAKAVLVGDLAAIEQALAVWADRPASGLGGSLVAQFAMGEGGKLNLGLSAVVPDLSRPAPDGKGRKPEGPLSLAYTGTYDPAADRLRIDALALVTRYARLDANGRVDEPAGRRLADLQGTLAPTWETVSALVAEMSEPKARLAGGPRPFRVKGPLSGGTLAAMLKGLDAEVGVELSSLDAFGLALGPAPLVVRCKAGALSIDPIETTLNSGRVVLKPGLTVDDAQGIALLLAKGSAIDGAEINDEVSKRVLTYVAPVLDEATHVNGKFSVTIEQGEFPITGPPTHRVKMTGQVVFQDVMFAPGPFAGQLLSLVGQPGAPGLRLQQPVQLAVANGRVMQKGLSIPLRGTSAISLEGSVGFDQTLDLRATVPITKGMLGARSGLDELVGENRVTVPIDGTVSKPRVNKQALQVAVRELSKNVFKRDLSKEAAALLDKLGPPSTPGGGVPKDAKGLEDELIRRLLPKRRPPAGAQQP
jgi:translocation and assembly module TamB